MVFSRHSKKKAGQGATVSAVNNTQTSNNSQPSNSTQSNNNTQPSNNSQSSNNSNSSQNPSESNNRTGSNNTALNENSTGALQDNSAQIPDHSSPPPSYATVTLSVPNPMAPRLVVPPVETVDTSTTAHPTDDSRIPQTPPPAYDELFSVMQSLDSK